MRSIRFLSLAVSLLALSACVTDRPAPVLDAPSFETWNSNAGSPSTEVRMDWWRELSDPGLDQLVQRALVHNADIGMATANYRAALALAGETGALRFPVGTVEGGLVETRVSAGAQPPGAAPDRFANQTVAQIGAALSWELDLFGGVEAAIDAARSGSSGALWARRGVEAAVAGAVVRAWIDHRAATVLESTLTRRVDALEEIVSRLERGVALGGVSRADLATAQAQLELERTELPVLQAQKRNAARRIAVLTGEAPRTTVEGSNPTAGLLLPSVLRVDDPAAVLRRRPDVAIAEARVAGAAALAGVARAELYPRISLSAAGQLAGEPGQLGDAGALGFTFGPRLQWSILDFQRVSARIRAADARAEAATFEWERMVLSALEETDSALDVWSQARLATANVRRAYDASVIAFNDIQQRSAAGAESQIALGRALSNRLMAETALRSAEHREMQAWAAANLALGAGWRDIGLTTANSQGSAP
jgi:NodT family efflux transporter outer membrane factor (OMF) lipoprotein